MNPSKGFFALCPAACPIEVAVIGGITPGYFLASALITDGRFSSGSRGAAIGHVSPEAADCGPIALVKNGGRIRINIPKKRLTLLVPEEELRRRKKQWKAPAPPDQIRVCRPLCPDGNVSRDWSHFQRKNLNPKYKNSNRGEEEERGSLFFPLFYWKLFIQKND